MEELYQIYVENFKREVYSYKYFKEVIQKSNVIDYKQSNKVVAFSVYKDNNLLLICVKKRCQRNKIGTYLLKKVENVIKQKYNELIIGSSNYFYVGTPDEYSNFFVKNNYEVIDKVSDYLSLDNKKDATGWHLADNMELEELLSILKNNDYKEYNNYLTNKKIYVYQYHNRIVASYIEKSSNYKELDKDTVIIDSLTLFKKIDIDIFKELKNNYSSPLIIKNINKNIFNNYHIDKYLSFNIAVKKFC